MKLLKNRTVLGILCIVLSLAICFLVTPLFNQAISQKTEIVRVQKSIKAEMKSQRITYRWWRWVAIIFPGM